MFCFANSAYWVPLCVLFVQLLRLQLVSKIISPDDGCPNVNDLSKWPLQPGVLVHVSKGNGVSISQLSPRMSPFKTTSVLRAKNYLRYKRNKSKVYARLERLKVLLGINRGPHHVPIGIKEGDNGGKARLLICLVSFHLFFVFFAC